MSNDPFRRPVLIQYRNKLWWWRGLADHAGRYHLTNPFDDRAGILAEPEDTRMVRGEERAQQIAAIDAELSERQIGGDS